MTGRVFLRLAHVEAIERAIGLCDQRGHLVRADMADAGAIGDVAGIGRSALERPDRTAPVSAMGERVPRQRPADRAVAQRPTLLGTPALISDWVPMIERVRPAQLTMMVVSGSGAAWPARSTSSAPGTLTEPGMFIVAYSSNRRASRMAMLALSAISFATSSALNDGVCRRASTSSPKAFE